MTENIDVLTHSSIRIRSKAGTIYFDPFQISEQTNDADFIFITHDHYDHFSVSDIKKIISDKTVVIVPEKMAAAAAEKLSGHEVVSVSVGESRTVNGLDFETVAAYNRMKPFHPRSAGWCGYIVCADGKRIYVAGDTDLTDEAKSVKCDVAIVPIGGTFTMDAKKAAELVNKIKPAAAIPSHYGNIVGKPSDADIFAKYVDKTIKVETKISF